MKRAEQEPEKPTNKLHDRVDALEMGLWIVNNPAKFKELDNVFWDYDKEHYDRHNPSWVGLSENIPCVIIDERVERYDNKHNYMYPFYHARSYYVIFNKDYTDHPKSRMIFIPEKGEKRWLKEELLTSE